MKVFGLLKRYKKILLEFITNVFSFSLFILAQQIIALPIISRFYNAEQFGKIVILVGFIGIITSMFGFSIGNARLLDQRFYNSLYLKAFWISNIIIGLVSFLLYYYLFSEKNSNSLIFLTICLLANFRNFFQSEYRIKDTHKLLLKQNFWYLIGIILGILIFLYKGNWLVIFFTAEVFSVLYSVYSFRKKGFFKLFNDNNNLKSTNITQLIINNGVSYSLSQYDRFLIYPILGSANVSLYYSASVSSKLGALVMNPLSNYVLGKLSTKNAKNDSKLIKFAIITSIFIMLGYFFMSVITTPILVKMLYPDYLANIMHLIIPICLEGAIKSGTNILKPFIMRCFSVKFYNKIFFVYGLLLIGLSVVFCIRFNLIGLAFANIIAGTTLFLSLLICLKVKIRRGNH